MRISLNWLNDYVDIKNIPATQVADLLTDLGLEVESIETIEPLQGKVIVGQVLTAEPHPDADKLRVCQVDIGDGQPLEIVCGAPNARAGIKVCVATVGSVLPGDFKIKKSKIRGVNSSGMLCAQDELGIGSDHDGIIEVEGDVELGTSVAELYYMNDTVLELGITPNRSDCFGYIGVARDLSAKLGIPLKMPSLDQLDIDDNLKTGDQVSIDITDAVDCPRFCALYVEDVATAPSPAWVQRRLLASGMRPINLLVDATNYVMLEYGQPIHAYDKRDLNDNKIVVRRARDAESFKTLDGETRQLIQTDLLICDGQGPVGLAGVMGGESSEVKEDTTALVIEVASFHGGLIRRTAKRLGLHTEASHRFERGTDVHACDQVAYRVAGLIQQLGAEASIASTPRIAGEAVDIYPAPWQAPHVALRTSRCRQILGAITLTPQQIGTALESLQFPMIDKTADEERLLFQVPSWRHDVTREIDLIEEVGRLRGYDKIPYSLPMMEIGTLPENPFIDFLDKTRITIAQSGFTEVISLPFVGRQDLGRLRLTVEHPFASPVPLTNPLAEDEGYMQPSVAISLIKALAHNRRHGNKGARLFELGRGYLAPDAIKEASGHYLDHLTEMAGHLAERAKDETRAIEHNYAAAILDQPWQDKSWLADAQPATFYHAKAMVELWLSSFAIASLSYKEIDAILIPYLHPSAAALIIADNVVIGYLGELHPETAVAFDFDPAQPPVLIELNLERFYRSQLQKSKYQTEINRFPPVTFDIALVVKDEVTHGQIEAALIRFNRRKHLTSYRLFDVYRGDKVAAGSKSMAYTLQFQSPKKTLNDAEVQKEVAALTEWLKQEVGAELR